jgi:hypothetical protein
MLLVSTFPYSFLLFFCSMVLDCNSLQEDFDLSLNDLSSVRRTGGAYSFLDARREELYIGVVEKREKRAKKVEGKHYRALAMSEALMNGNVLRKELLNYLVEANGGESTGHSFSGTGIKSRFIRERGQRLLKFNNADKERRDEAMKDQQSLAAPGC